MQIGKQRVAGQPLGHLLGCVAAAPGQSHGELHGVNLNLHHAQLLCGRQCGDMFARAIHHHHPTGRHQPGITRLNAIVKPVRLPAPGQPVAVDQARKLFRADLIMVRARL